ncbi:MAG: LEA type 2 family protein [Bacteroidales bacterium]|nr:LEA type 2 family protein [Bacteroidales bacterium]
MKRLLHIVLLVVTVITATSCGVSKVKDIKITSVDFKYITPTSSRSLDAVLLLGIDNPAPAINVSSLEGTVSYGGREIATVTADGIMLQKKSSQVYELPCSASLVDGVSLLSLLPIFAGSPNGLTANVRLHAAIKNGPGTDLVFNDLNILNFTR